MDEKILEGSEDTIVMTDEEGNEYFYQEEVIIQIGEKRFAILVPLEDDEEEDECGCDCGCGDHGHDHGAECGCEDDDADAAFIVRIDKDDNGEDIYVDPTDEEFEEVQKAYEKMLEEEEAE